MTRAAPNRHGEVFLLRAEVLEGGDRTVSQRMDRSMPMLPPLQLKEWR